MAPSCMTQQCWRKQVFIYRILILGRLRALLLRALFSHKTQHFPCSPPAYKSEPCPEVPHILKLAAQTGLHPFWKALLWVSESPSSCTISLLQDLGYIFLSLHVMVQGKHVPCYTGSWWSPGKQMSQQSGFSVPPSEKQKSVIRCSQSLYFSS